MRIDYHTFPHIKWSVFHVPTAKYLDHVMWVDTDEARYTVLVTPIRVVADRIVLREVQAKRIEVHPNLALILIDPVEGVEPEVTTTRRDELAPA